MHFITKPIRSAISWILAAAAVFSISAAIRQDAAASGDTVEMPILVIDAGHGGADGRASSRSGLLESSVNLDVALRMEALAELLGVKYVMSRSSEDIDYPDSAGTIREKKVADQKARVALVTSTSGAILISIHQNTYPTAQPRGSQVLYAATEGSKELGEALHGALIKALYPDSRRVAAPISEDVYLLKKINCPAILIECGFLSNSEDEALLDTSAHRLKIAAVIMAAYWDYIQQ